MDDLLLNQFLLLGAVLFCLGVYGVLARRNAVLVLMSIELILNAVNINLIAFGALHGSVAGAVFALFVIAIAAAEVGVGLAIVLLIYRNRRSVDLDAILAQADRDRGVVRDTPELDAGRRFLADLDLDDTVGRAEKRELTGGLEVVADAVHRLEMRIAIAVRAARPAARRVSLGHGRPRARARRGRRHRRVRPTALLLHRSARDPLSGTSGRRLEGDDERQMHL